LKKRTNLKRTAAALISLPLLVQPLAAQSPQPAGSTSPTCSIQIAVLKVDRAEAQSSADGVLATVTVQLSVTGPIPKGAAATVAMLTYSSEPIGNNVRFDDQQTLPLKGSPTVFVFKVYGTRTTARGHVIIQADIRAATAGIQVKRHPNAADRPGASGHHSTLGFAS
jgi:hypothetical protein